MESHLKQLKSRVGIKSLQMTKVGQNVSFVGQKLSGLQISNKKLYSYIPKAKQK